MPAEQNRYELLERIGVGGMAEVFRARMVGPAGFQKVVALKRILEDFSSDQDFLHRFVDEARLTARLQHPNICQVLDFGVMEGRYYLTLEYVNGLDLAQVLGRLEYHGDLLPPELCLMVVGGVLRGLGHAHRAVDEQGRALVIVHRDVSPQNVLLSINGDVKLSDFGAAKANAAVRQARTQDNIALGKLAYMAPEQRRGKPVDGRADVYGAGVLLAEMLEGPTLFRRSAALSGPNRSQLVDAAGERFPRAVAPRVSAVIYRALDEHPEQRFDDAASMLAEVELCAAELGTRATADQLGRLVQHLMEDEEFLTDRHGHYQVQRPVPRPAGAVTRSLSSGGPAREERGAAPVDPSALALAQTAIAPAEASGAEDLVTQVIRGRGEREHFGEVDTQVVHEDERADFEQLETRVVRGRRDESEDLATQIHRGGRDATPAPTAIASDLGLAQQLRDAPGDPSLAEPSQEQRLAPSPPVDAERAGTAPVSRDPAAQPVDPPPWAFAPRALDRDFEDGPTEVEQSPWLDSTGRAQSPTAAAPAAPGPDQTRTEVIRTRSGKRRSVRLMLLVLLLAVIFAGLGAQVVVRWMGERDRSPWPPEPAEAPASTDVAPVSSDPTPASSDPTPASSDPAPAGAGSASVDQVPRTEPQTEPAAAPGREPRTPAPAGRVAAPGGGRSPSPAAAPRTPEEQPQPERARPVAEPAAAPAAPAAATATRITVTADPPGRAYVDGRLVGPRTPVRATPVAPGEHRVMVVYSSTGRSETRSVRVRAGEHVVVSFAASP